MVARWLRDFLKAVNSTKLRTFELFLSAFAVLTDLESSMNFNFKHIQTLRVFLNTWKEIFMFAIAPISYQATSLSGKQ